MNKKKVFTNGLVLVLAILIALGAAWQPAMAKDRLKWYRLEENSFIQVGKQALSVTNIPLGVSSVLIGPAEKPLPPRFYHKVDIEHRPPALEVHFLNRTGGNVDRIQALVYVNFSIGIAEQRLWWEGGTDNIAIWYLNERVGSWEYCPTRYVESEGGGFPQLSCLAPGSGYYVLGQGEFDTEIFNPYTYTGEKVVDFDGNYATYSLPIMQ